MQFGEEPKEGIIREIKEEVGLNIKDIIPIDVTSFLENDVYTLMIGYKAIVEENNVTLSYEHDQFKWVTAEEFFSMNIPETYKTFLKNLERSLQIFN